MSVRFQIIAAICLAVIGEAGCHYKPHITAVSLDPCTFGQETGIPFYLPKPLLIVAKNFRNIEEAKVGLTDTAPIPTGYDDQSKYADVNARTNFQGFNGAATTAPAPPSSAPTNTGTAEKSAQHIFSNNGAPVTPLEAPSDGLSPNTFFTYQIVFVPDMAQKYGLKIRGGPGEIRAAMNLVNGWQFTGIGPYYMKDSSTAQNILAAGITARLGGQAVQDVLSGVSDLSGALQSGAIGADTPAVQSLAKTISELPVNLQPMTLPNFAEIYVYEPNLMPDGRMEWAPIVQLAFHRDYLGKESTEIKFQQQSSAVANVVTTVQSGLLDPSVQTALQAAGIPVAEPTSSEATATGLQSGPLTTPSGGLAGGISQVQVDCGDNCACEKCSKQFNLLNLAGGLGKKKRGRVERRVVHGIPFLRAASQGGAMQDPGSGFSSVGPGGRTDIQSGELGQSGATFDRAILNQPTVNQPRFSGGDETLAPVVPSTDKAHKQLEDGGTGMQDPGVQPQRPSADPESNANGPQSDADGDSALPAPELIDPSN